MRLIKMMVAIILGTIAVVWGFCTFIMKINVVEMRHKEDGVTSLRVDDGYTFTDAVSCVIHCKERTEWNLQNSIILRGVEPVTKDEMVSLGDCFIFNQVYPTGKWVLEGPHGKTYFKYWVGTNYFRLVEAQRHEIEQHRQPTAAASPSVGRQKVDGQ